MIIFGVILAALLALGMLLDSRTRTRSGARDGHGFAVVEVLVVGTVAAITVGMLILAVGAVRGA